MKSFLENEVDIADWTVDTNSDMPLAIASPTMNASRSPDRPETRPGVGKESPFRYVHRSANNPGYDSFGRLLQPFGDGRRIDAQPFRAPIPVTGEKAAVWLTNNLAPAPHDEHSSRVMRGRAQNSSAASLITYGAADGRVAARSSPRARPNMAVDLMNTTSEATLPGDLLVRKSGLPIRTRMGALVRQRSIDVSSLIIDYLQRCPGIGSRPQRGLASVDVPTFRRCLCYAFGEQWSQLGMTTPEFLETYSPYIANGQSADGSTLVNWRAFATDLAKAAGVRAS